MKIRWRNLTFVNTVFMEKLAGSSLVLDSRELKVLWTTSMLIYEVNLELHLTQVPGRLE